MVFNYANYGRNIFMYSNIQTKQVVYSLTRALKNDEALKQLPFIGKHSKPAAIRKDHWAPMATVSFPDPAIGMKTYHKLRQFRKLHELQYPDEWRFETSYKERKYKIMDQRANSIADLAESLRIELARKSAQDVKGEVTVRWANILDAEYAKEWPEGVVHDAQGRPERYCAPKLDVPSSPAKVVEKVEV